MMYGSVRAQVVTFLIKQINRSERLASLELKLNMATKELARIIKSLSEVAGESGNARKKATLESKLKEKDEDVDALTDRLDIVQKELAEIRKSLSEVAEEARNTRKKVMTVAADLLGQARKKFKTDAANSK